MAKRPRHCGGGGGDDDDDGRIDGSRSRMVVSGSHAKADPLVPAAINERRCTRRMLNARQCARACLVAGEVQTARRAH